VKFEQRDSVEKALTFAEKFKGRLLRISKARKSK